MCATIHPAVHSKTYFWRESCNAKLAKDKKKMLSIFDTGNNFKNVSGTTRFMQSSSPTKSWEHYKTVSIHRTTDTELKEKQTLDVFFFFSFLSTSTC